jgi:hypothetical protein
VHPGFRPSSQFASFPQYMGEASGRRASTRGYKPAYAVAFVSAPYEVQRRSTVLILPCGRQMDYPPPFGHLTFAIRFGGLELLGIQRHCVGLLGHEGGHVS